MQAATRRRVKRSLACRTSLARLDATILLSTVAAGYQGRIIPSIRLRQPRSRHLDAPVKLSSLAHDVALRTSLRLALALAVVLAALAPAAGSPRADSGKDERRPVGSECHCAMQAPATTIALRSESAEQSRPPLLDASAEMAETARTYDAVLARLAARVSTPRSAAVAPRAGFDATAPPATPLV